MGLQGFSGGYRGLLVVTKAYRGLKRVTKGYRGYKGFHGVTGG